MSRCSCPVCIARRHAETLPLVQDASGHYARVIDADVVLAVIERESARPRPPIIPGRMRYEEQRTPMPRAENPSPVWPMHLRGLLLLWLEACVPPELREEEEDP